MISKKDVLLYFMFMAVMLPFQIFTDIILHNASELYSGFAVYDFFDYVTHKYENRKTR